MCFLEALQNHRTKKQKQRHLDKLQIALFLF